MHIETFDRDNGSLRGQLADLLASCFPHGYALGAAEEAECLLEDDKIALAAMDHGRLAGFAGAVPHYGVTGWELHPLAVFPEYQGQGTGTKLILAMEDEVRKRGGITLYLGTDDEFGQTSLGETDLYDRLFEKIETVRNFKRHPYEFYQKIGYIIVGVLPDVNGYGKPDILMAKRLTEMKNIT